MKVHNAKVIAQIQYKLNMRMRFPNSFLLITFLYLCCFTQLLDGRGNNIGRNNPFRNSKQPLRQQKHDEIFSNEFDPSNSNKYAYENDMHDTEIERSRRFNKKRRNSLVSAYTSNTASRLFVAVAAGTVSELLCKEQIATNSILVYL